MRVCFVNSFYAPNELGGAEVTVRYLAEAMARQGHDVSVISIAPHGAGTKSELNGVRTYYVPVANIYSQVSLKGKAPPIWKKIIWNLIEVGNPLMTRRIGQIFAQERPDVVTCHNLRGLSVGAWIAARRQRIPIVQTLHDYFLACPSSTMRSGDMNCVKQCTLCRMFSNRRRRLSNLPSAVTSVSRRTLQRLEESGFFTKTQGKFIIFGNNTATPPFSPRADVKGRALRLGYLGRIEPIKGLDVLMGAMARLPPDAATLVIGGQCPDEERARLLTIAAGADVSFLGRVDPAAFFPQIDALVVPSVWEEPLSRVIHEALAFGVPSIVSRVGGMPEIVEEGVTGFLFEANNSHQLGTLIQELHDNGLPAARMSRACLHRSEQFAPEKIFQQYYDAFRSVVSK